MRQMGWRLHQRPEAPAVIAKSCELLRVLRRLQVVLLGGQALPLESVQATRCKLALKRAIDGRQEAPAPYK